MISLVWTVFAILLSFLGLAGAYGLHRNQHVALCKFYTVFGLVGSLICAYIAGASA